MNDTSVDSVIDVIPRSSAPTRFVPMPMEADTPASSGPELMYSEWVTFDIEWLERIAESELIGTLFALLQRYTQQRQIAVDVIVLTGGAEYLAAFDLDVDPDTVVGSLISEIAARLSMLGPTAGPDLEASSNVAMTLLSSATDTGWPKIEAALFQRRYDINFVLDASDGALKIRALYARKLFRSSAVDWFLHSYSIMLEAVLAGPETAVGRLPVLSPEQLHALTVDLDSGTATYPTEPVHRIFEVLAQCQPEATACTYHGDRLSYGELDRQSRRLAAYLLELGVGAEKPVAVCIPPSLNILPAILAIWKAGGIYLPLDPTHPESNIRRMLDEARPVIVLTLEALTPLTVGFRQFCFDRDLALLSDDATIELAAPVQLTDAAYLFYTSGTTGKAKGVVATHDNLRQYVHSGIRKYGFSAEDVFVSLARYTFSISLFDLISPLCCGGSVRILDRDQILDPGALCAALESVTVVHAGPSLLGSLFRYIRATPSAPRALPKMRHASSGGDMIPPSVIEEMKTVFPRAELFVIYGCTEVSCMGTTYPIPRDIPASRNLVGKAFPNVTVRVLDANGGLVPFGVVGEICFAGEGVVRGYLQMPELTAEKFAAIDGRRFYRTGDVGRLHLDGNLEILGRRDFQVQMRGIRIELAGIEKTIVALGLAAQCAVIAKTFGETDARLVAFVIRPSVDGLPAFRKALGKELPDYMLPQHVVVLEAMPLTHNGKLDRNRLKDLPWERQLGSGEERTEIANSREQEIADIFARVLECQAVGIDDSFFDLGGDSLLAILALEEIRLAMGVKIPPHVMFEDGTARAIARFSSSTERSEALPLLLSDDGSLPPIFMLSGIHIYRPLARRLEGVFSIYGVFSPAEAESSSDEVRPRSVMDLASEYLSIIRRQQPVGPYILFGYSFSGIVAYEVCRQLQALGEEIRLLAIVDSDLPEWTLFWRFRLSQIRRLHGRSPRQLASFIWRRFQEMAGWKLQPIMRFRDHKKLAPLEAKRDAVNIVAAEDYMPKITRYLGNVLLITAGKRLNADPLRSRDCGWAQYMPALEIHSVDADHFEMMSDEPYVSQIAEFFLRSVERAS